MDLKSAARSSSEIRSKISLGSRLAPSMRSFSAAVRRSGTDEKFSRMAAPRWAGLGCAAERRYWIASPTSANASVKAARSADGAILSSSAAPSGLETKRPSRLFSSSNSSRSALVVFIVFRRAGRRNRLPHLPPLFQQMYKTPEHRQECLCYNVGTSADAARRSAYATTNSRAFDLHT